MKHVTKLALALALVTGVSATAMSIDNASARGNNDGWQMGQQQNFHGKQGRGHGMRRDGGRGMGPMGMMLQFDTDKDGVLSRDELEAGLAKKITDNDTDGDGAVSLAEFEAEWMRMTRTMMVRAFQHMDRDGSGTITQEEIKEPAMFMFDRRDFNDDGVIDRNDRFNRQGRWSDGPMQKQMPDRGPKGATPPSK